MIAAVALGEPACSSSSSSPPSAMAPAPAPTTPPAPLDCAQGDAGGWPTFAGNVCGTRAGSTSDPITAQTVSKLTVKWKFTASGDVSATPAVVGGQVYFGDWGGMFYRLDAATGQVVWARSVADILNPSLDAGSDAATEGTDAGLADGPMADSESPSATAEAGTLDGGAPEAAAADAAQAAPADAGDDAEPAPEPVDAAAGDGAAAGTGLKLAFNATVRNTPVVANGLVIFGVTTAPTMVALDQNTGAVVWRAALDSNPFAVITSSPILEDGRIYLGVSSGEEAASLISPSYVCCKFRGSVVALDAATGKVLWQTYTIEDGTYRNADGTLSGFAGAAVWSTPTLDRNRKLLYVSTGNNYAAPAAVVDGGAPLPAGDHVESILALDLATGAIRWSQRMTTGDIWTFGNTSGPDWDFGAGPNLFQISIDGGLHDIVGAGQKSGAYWAIDADTHSVLWHTQVGPGGHLGGIQWGTATDGTRVYIGVNDQTGTKYRLGGPGHAGNAGLTAVGSWAALDPASGATLWQVANPAMTAPLNGASVNGPVSVVNGVVFGGSMDSDGMMYAFDASSGKILWSFKSGGTVYGGPAIVDGVVYWGSGYPSSRLGFGTPGTALYAFALGQ
jgi:polyvinyl alcohol dehydrogenase (cytochrome)